MERNELYSIFRFIFCFGIVLSHFGPRNFIASHKWLCSGAIFVTFYFVFSGFMASISASKTRNFDSFDFIAKRLSKLLPLYYFALALFVALGVTEIDPVSLSLDLMLLQSWIPSFALRLNFPAWFMSCLFSFILFSPIVIIHARKYKTRPQIFLFHALILWAATQIILTILLNHPSFYKGFPSAGHDLIFYFPLSHFCSFVIGVALGNVYVLSGPIRLGKWTSISLLSMTVLIIFGGLQFEWTSFFSLKLPLGASFFAPIFGALVLSIALLPRDVSKLFSIRLFYYLGEVSFPVYLLQYPIRIIVTTIFPFVGKGIMEMPVFLFYFAILMVGAVLFRILVQEKTSRFLISGFRVAKEISNQCGQRVR